MPAAGGGYRRAAPVRRQGEGVLPEPPARGGGTVVRERGDFNANWVDPEAVIEGLTHLLRVWELNRQHRVKRAPFRRDVPRGERLRGLFGGG